MLAFDGDSIIGLRHAIDLNFEVIGPRNPVDGENLTEDIRQVNILTKRPAVTLFAAGDRVLLIQMKGAAIDDTDAATYGMVTGYGTAGNYELLTIEDINFNISNTQKCITQILIVKKQ